ncbi:MAG: hypothetical protein EXR11_12655 [Rhodospirillaceae bacterium]|nr:hypothetical protein [Rhodospirillaceae bacterium]
MRISPTTWLVCALLASPTIGQTADGRERIAFTVLHPSHAGLFLSDIDGQNERPLVPPGDDYNASFSADGQWIVFTSERAGSADIYRVHADRTVLQGLTDSTNYDDQAVLSPDGETLAFVSTRDTGTANIWLLDIKKQRVTNLTKSASGNFRPSWSPDGAWIAFTSDRDTPLGRNPPSWELMQSIAVYIVHPNGSGLRRLTPLGELSGSPRWAPDSRHLVYYHSPEPGAGPAGPTEPSTQIVSVDISTGASETQTSGPKMKVAPQYVGDKEIGYLVESGNSRSFELTSGRQGVAGQIHDPSVSPDGKTVVYHKVAPTDFSQRDGLKPVFSINPKFELFLTGFYPDYSRARDQIVMNNPAEHWRSSMPTEAAQKSFSKLIRLSFPPPGRRTEI